jgi:hypothetical protein
LRTKGGKRDPLKRWALPEKAGWNADLVELPEDVLISESKSRTYDGLWLMEPEQFLFDAMPRAEKYVNRFPPPPTEALGVAEPDEWYGRLTVAYSEPHRHLSQPE